MASNLDKYRKDPKELLDFAELMSADLLSVILKEKRGERINIGKDTNDPHFKLLIAVNKLWNENWGRCLSPTWNCERPPIKAHSIQNSRIIDRLAEDGHVSMIRIKFQP